MVIIPPETKIQWEVYNELKTNPYWNQQVSKKCVSTGKTEILSKFSEGEKAIIYDTFKQIDSKFDIDYSKINLQYYLSVIDEECNHKNLVLGLAIKNIMKQVFNIDIEYVNPSKL